MPLQLIAGTYFFQSAVNGSNASTPLQLSSFTGGAVTTLNDGAAGDTLTGVLGGSASGPPNNQFIHFYTLFDIGASGTAVVELTMSYRADTHYPAGILSGEEGYDGKVFGSNDGSNWTQLGYVSHNLVAFSGTYRYYQHVGIAVAEGGPGTPNYYQIDYYLTDLRFYKNAPVGVAGCMDPTASNYNPLATQDTTPSSCLYTPGGGGGTPNPGSPASPGSPGYPGNPTCANVITWNAVPQALSYTLLRATSPSGPFSVLASGLTATTYSDPMTPALSGETFYYEVEAVSAAGAGPPSAVIAVTTSCPVLAPPFYAEKCPTPAPFTQQCPTPAVFTRTVPGQELHP